MKISTFTIVAGSAACNAKCPYCVSKMTGKELGMKEPEVNWRNFDKACRLAQVNQVSTVLFTGGCNFRCPFCYNTNIVLNPNKMPDIKEKDVLSFLVENEGLYHAVMVTGGEPTMHKDLPAFLLKVKELGLLTGWCSRPMRYFLHTPGIITSRILTKAISSPLFTEQPMIMPKA